MDVHSFDGQLGNDMYYTSYTGTPDELEKLRKIWNLEVVKELSPGAKQMLIILLNDVGKDSNCDSRSNMTVENILYEIQYRIEMLEFPIEVGTFEDQLIDMKTGMCVQGRTSRLIQVMLSLVPKPDKFVDPGPLETIEYDVQDKC